MIMSRSGASFHSLLLRCYAVPSECSSQSHPLLELDSDIMMEMASDEQDFDFTAAAYNMVDDDLPGKADVAKKTQDARSGYDHFYGDFQSLPGGI